jgi:hypothetical protein
MKMKSFWSLLIGVISTLTALAGITLFLLSNNNIAIQVGGEDNTIEQKIESRPSASQTVVPAEPVAQPQTPPPTQSPDVTSTQPVPDAAGLSAPTTPVHPPAPAQSRTSISNRTYEHSNVVQYEEECECPEEEAVSEDETEIVVTYEETEEVDCEEEEPPAA